jgi:putative two-component system response regulator
MPYSNFYKNQEQLTTDLFTLVIENYDNETGIHNKRIQKYTSILLSQIFKKNYQMQQDISMASLLHDIGKTTIPKSILNKPGKLDVNEFEIIKGHSKEGYEILIKMYETSQCSYFKIASDIALSHHEKWNGKGYPYGLKGEDISLNARVVTIADVYDAITSKRVYKEAISHNEAVKIINNEKAKSFDPDLVDIFLNQHQLFENVSNETIYIN